MNFSLKVLDVGGGLGVDYTGERELDFILLNTSLERIRNAFGIEETWVEMGRFLVADCGKFYSRVVDRKQTRGQDLLVLNSGINALVRPALTNEAFPSINYSRPNSGARSSFKMSGPLCTALDQLGKASLCEETQVGDWIEFSKVGAYGFSESMPFFLAHDLAAEYVVVNQELKCVREPLKAEKYLR